MAEALPIQAPAQSSASRAEKQTQFVFSRGAAYLNRGFILGKVQAERNTKFIWYGRGAAYPSACAK
ncbi:hypothetical protein [uncultured Alistipes sp.]|uniref:hypothetical protein n=1 Tax=uncultured Alistipes sp. TaxID=538949 RepID=UPI002729EB8A|nr:hypothetical protein [uncultured Alistipes sp.]